MRRALSVRRKPLSRLNFLAKPPPSEKFSDGALGASQHRTERSELLSLSGTFEVYHWLSAARNTEPENNQQLFDNSNLMRFLYLHGFASGPQSRKAREFQGALAASRDFPALEIPQLDADDFEHLTVSGQLGVLERTLRGEAASLIGSSLGGYLAALYASHHPEIDRLVLLAPAFGFSSRWNELTGPEKMRSLRETGWLEVFHYAAGAPRRVHYGLSEDANRYPAEPDFSQPALIFHGLRDDVVPIACSRRFVASHPNATLFEVDSDHELTSALPEITAASVPFLRLGWNQT